MGIKDPWSSWPGVFVCHCLSQQLSTDGTVGLMRGTVRKRGGRWQALITVTDMASGKPRQLSKTHDTKRDATEWLARQQVRFAGGRQDASRIQFATVLDQWIETFADDWSQSTKRTTVSIVELHIRPKWERTPVSDISTMEIDRWITSLRRGRSAGTVTRIIGVMHRIMQQAVTWQMIDRNPVAGATKPKQERPQIVPPSDDEVLALVGAMRDYDEDLGLFVMLAAATGARRGELCALRWKNIDLRRGRVRIAESAVLGENDEMFIKSTKTGGIRTVSVGANMRQRLAGHRKACEKRAREADGVVGDNSFVFSLDVDGARPWRPDYVTSHFERVKKKIGLPGVRLHDLRHYQATKLLTSGVDLATVAGRLGHANGGRTTLAVYAHFIEAADEEASLVVDAMFD